LVETEIRQYFQPTGEVQVLGPDLYSGSSPNNLGSFQEQTGVTYPLLLYGNSATGGNLLTLYGQWDNFVVINKQGIVRYVASQHWPYGNRYHPEDIRGCVDSLLSSPVGIGDRPGPSALALASAPNPFRGRTLVELAHPGAGGQPVRVAVYDAAGRRVATLWDGAAAGDRTHCVWDGRDAEGAQLHSGVYLIQAEVGGMRLSRRVVLLR
jgi:hypothetical protein